MRQSSAVLVELVCALKVSRSGLSGRRTTDTYSRGRWCCRQWVLEGRESLWRRILWLFVVSEYRGGREEAQKELCGTWWEQELQGKELQIHLFSEITQSRVVATSSRTDGGDVRSATCHNPGRQAHRHREERGEPS